jgi:hypothetical protein
LRRTASATPILPTSWSSPARRIRAAWRGAKPSARAIVSAYSATRREWCAVLGSRRSSASDSASVVRSGERSPCGLLAPEAQHRREVRAVGDGAVATELLGGVEGGVGGAHERLGRRVIDRGGDAGAGGQGDAVLGARARDRAAQAVGGLQRAGLVGGRQQQAELLAADATHPVDASQRGGEGLPRRAAGRDRRRGAPAGR